MGLSRFLLPLLVLVPGCRTPTSVELRLSTNVSCADHPSTAIIVSRESTATAEPATITTACQPDGTIGSLVILPASSKDETLLVRVVTSIKGPVDTACQPPAYGPSCIVSKRRLKFVAHEELLLPVVQDLDCAGLVCGESQTCLKGRTCGSDQVDVDHCASSPADCGVELIGLPGGAGGQGGGSDGGQGGAGISGSGQGGAGQSQGGAGASGAGAGGAGMGGAGMAGAGGAGAGGAGMAGAGGEGGGGMGGAGGAPVVGPRPISPLSLGTVTSQTPRLRWALAPGTDGALVELCHERTCASPLFSVPVTGTSMVVPAALPPGRVYWRLTSMTGQAVSEDRSPTWSFTVGHRSAPIDTSWGATPDFDNDGFADVLIGAKGASTTGLVQVLPGRAGGPQLPPALSLQVPGVLTFGKAIGIADVNGDGYADALISAESSDQTFLFLGSAQGLGSKPFLALPGQLDAHSGRSIASAGDLNGDGYGDFVVSGHNASSNQGLISVFYGSATGEPTLQVIPGTVPGSQFGYTVAGIGDLDGDGFADLATCAPNASSTYVFLGSAAGIAASPILIPDSNSDTFGCSVAAAGDVNGDGYADFLSGGFSSTTPATALFLGGPTGSALSPKAFFTGLAGGDANDRSAGLGDLDGDGFADIGTVTFGPDNGGQVLVVLGSAAALAAPVMLSQGSPGDYVGWSMAGAGDLDGDGLDDLVLGARGVSSGTGQVTVFLGHPVTAMTPLTPLLTIHGSAPGDVLGWSVAALDLGGYPVIRPVRPGWRLQ